MYCIFQVGNSRPYFHTLWHLPWETSWRMLTGCLQLMHKIISHGLNIACMSYKTPCSIYVQIKFRLWHFLTVYIDRRNPWSEAAASASSAVIIMILSPLVNEVPRPVRLLAWHGPHTGCTMIDTVTALSRGQTGISDRFILQVIISPAVVATRHVDITTAAQLHNCYHACMTRSVFGC